MKICLITAMTPASENIRGTSAHPYHILKGRCAHIEVEIYSYNFNNFSNEEIKKVESELNTIINVIKIPLWYELIFKLKISFIRLFLKYPLFNYVKLPKQYIRDIKQKRPDIIWVFCAEWSRIINQFEGFKRIHTMPDSEALYYYRMLGQRFVTHDKNKFWRCAFMYPKYLALERNYSTDSSIHYHLVGEQDTNFLRKMNPGIQAHFIRHPHYELRNKDENMKVNFHAPKIRLLLAGQYNYYMKQDADEFIAELCKAKSLVDKFEFTFLGKGWEDHVQAMKAAGWQVQHISFAPDYIEEITKHDIQITPISIGTGTKGKVLDAIANGLLVIGTWYALENVAVEDGVSCICCDEAERLPRILAQIADDPVRYERMALAGREAVLREHGREKVAKEFFGLFEKP